MPSTARRQVHVVRAYLVLGLCSAFHRCRCLVRSKSRALMVRQFTVVISRLNTDTRRGLVLRSIVPLLRSSQISPLLPLVFITFLILLLILVGLLNLILVSGIATKPRKLRTS